MYITKSILHVTVILSYIMLISVIVFNWQGRILFGLGLADIVYCILIFLSLVVGTILYVRSLRSNIEYLSTGDKYLIAACILFDIFILLKISILRGPAAPWDGNLFF